MSTAGDVLEGDLQPTSELDLHLDVYAATGTAAQVAQGPGTDAGDYSLETVEDFAKHASPLA